MRAEDPVLIARLGAIVGHGESRGHCGLTAVSLVMSGRLSSRLSACSPLARPAPGISSFPCLCLLLPPAHFALGCDDFGDRVLPFDAVLQWPGRFLVLLLLQFARPIHLLVVCFLQVHKSCRHEVLLPLVVQ